MKIIVKDASEATIITEVLIKNSYKVTVREIKDPDNVWLKNYEILINKQTGEDQ